MPTNREIISAIRSDLRILSADAMLNDRAILAEARSATLYLVKQQTDRRKLFNSPNLFTYLPCIEMQEAPLSECCETTSTIMVAKSINPIPKIAEGIYGLLVQQVAGVDNMKQFIQVTPRRLSNLLSLPARGGKQVYWWVYNGHIYVSNSDTKAINIAAFFEEDVPNELLFATVDCDCKPNPSNDELCKNPLDREFKCPGFLVDTVKKVVSEKLLNTYFKIKQDFTDDNLDAQAVNTPKE